MKWLLSFREKIKFAFLLPVMVVLMITMIIVSKREVEQIDKSVSSIYYDRLVAGRTIAQVMDLLYENRFLLEKHMQSDSLLIEAQIDDQLHYNYSLMDSFMHEFEKTKLIKEEVIALQAYWLKNKAHRTFQQEILKLSKSDNKAKMIQIYGQQEERAFQAVLIILRQLYMLQPRVGKELLLDSQNRIRIIQEISFIEIAFIIILCAVIEMIFFLMLAKIHQKAHPPDQKYWLN